MRPLGARGRCVRLSDLRKSQLFGQWVLVRPRKAVREWGQVCPFCPGNEALTPPEIAAYRTEGSRPNGPGWQVRVIPELDPYFRVEWELVREGLGIYDRVSPRGASEVIIESSHHDDSLSTMGEEQLEQVLWMYRDRVVDLKRDTQIRDILITRRHRKPGSRVSHPRSRVTAIPIIFDDIRRELVESRGYYQYKRRCLLCDIIRQELTAEERVVRLTPHFVVLIPYAARVPLETRILPRQHHCAFEEISPAAVRDLARVLSGYSRILAGELRDPSVEMALHTAPNLASKVLKGEWATITEDYHWHLEVLVQPERLHRVGGIFINELPPEEAARQLRESWR